MRCYDNRPSDENRSLFDENPAEMDPSIRPCRTACCPNAWLSIEGSVRQFSSEASAGRTRETVSIVVVVVVERRPAGDIVFLRYASFVGSGQRCGQQLQLPTARDVEATIERSLGRRHSDEA